jgi:hypothetical protein
MNLLRHIIWILRRWRNWPESVYHPTDAIVGKRIKFPVTEVGKGLKLDAYETVNAVFHGEGGRITSITVNGYKFIPETKGMGEQ